MPPVSLEFDEAHQGRFLRINSLLACDGVQRSIDVRQMIRRDVAHKCADDFVVAHAPVQPAQKQNELHSDRNKRGQDGGPVDGHVGTLRNTGSK